MFDTVVGQDQRTETQLFAGVERADRILRNVSAALPADKDPTQGQRPGEHDHRHTFHRSQDHIERRRTRYTRTWGTPLSLVVSNAATNIKLRFQKT